MYPLMYGSLRIYVVVSNMTAVRGDSDERQSPHNLRYKNRCSRLSSRFGIYPFGTFGLWGFFFPVGLCGFGFV